MNEKIDVFRAESKETKKNVAIKIMTGDIDYESTLSEIKIMKHSTCPYLISFFECYFKDEILSIGIFFFSFVFF